MPQHIGGHGNVSEQHDKHEPQQPLGQSILHISDPYVEGEKAKIRIGKGCKKPRIGRQLRTDVKNASVKSIFTPRFKVGCLVLSMTWKSLSMKNKT